jgi:hypothetical protein
MPMPFDVSPCLNLACTFSVFFLSLHDRPFRGQTGDVVVHDLRDRCVGYLHRDWLGPVHASGILDRIIQDRIIQPEAVSVLYLVIRFGVRDGMSDFENRKARRGP